MDDPLLQILRSGKALSAAGDDLNAILTALQGTQRIRGTSLSPANDSIQLPAVVEQLDATIAKQGTQNRITLDATTAGNGAIAITATLSPQSSQPLPSGDATVAIRELNLAPFRTLAPLADTSLPFWQGTLNGDISASAQDAHSLSSEGALTLTDLKLRGGALGKDTPHLPSLEVAYGISRKDDLYRVTRADIRSSFLTANGSGDLYLTPDGSVLPRSLTIESKLNIPGLLSQFPHTLQLKKGLRFSSGDLSAQAIMIGNESSDSLTASLATHNVSAILEGRTITLSRPLQLKVKAARSPAGLSIEKLSLDSPFATLQGKGTIDDMSIVMDANLDSALKEARQFADLGQLKAKGQVHANLTLKNRGEKGREFTSEIHTSDLVFAPQPASKTKLPGLGIQISASVFTDDNNTPTNFKGVTVLATNKTVKANALVSSIRPPDEDEWPTIEGANINIRTDVHELMRSMDPSIPAPLIGTVSLKTSANVAKDTLHLSETRVNAGPLKLVEGTKVTVLTTQKSSLTGSVTVDQKHAALKKMVLAT